jgi:methionyl aminopeptidase
VRYNVTSVRGAPMANGLAFLIAIAVVVVAFAALRRRAMSANEPPDNAPGDAPLPPAVLADARRIAPLLAQVISEAGGRLAPGMTTREIDRLIVEGIARHKLQPAMLGFHGYPAASTISVNDQVLHVPPSDRRLQPGDLVTIQSAARSEHAFANLGWTCAVGVVTEEKARLLKAVTEALIAGQSVMRSGRRTGDVGAAIQGHIEAAGFSVVRDYVGYAIGRQMMEGPQLPCYGRAGIGPRSKARAVFNIHV